MEEAAQALSDSDQTPDKNKKKNRCFSCRKKVGLTGKEKNFARTHILSRGGSKVYDSWTCLPELILNFRTVCLRHKQFVVFDKLIAPFANLKQELPYLV